MSPRRKRELKKYTVTIIREIEHRAVVEDVVAESEDVAKQMAQEMADEPRSGYWQENHVIAQTIRTKVQP
jgi:hypothetical protein